jgi:hypothetical protein
MDKHANIHFDGNKFTVTDRHGRTDRNRDAFANFIVNAFANTKFDRNDNPDRNTDANFDAIFGAYYDPNGHGYAAAY